MAELQTSVFIGRDGNTSRIGAFMSAQKYTLLDEIASNCVSRYKPQENTAHCKLEIYKNGDLKLINLNLQNVTYVNGRQIDRAWISDDAIIELGYDHYRLPLTEMLKKIGWVKPYSISHLQGIYQEYQDRLMDLQLKQQREAAKQRFQGIFSLLGMTVFLVPDSILGGSDVAMIFKGVCTGLALLLCIYFTVRSFNPNNSFPMKKKEVDLWLKREYRCPNPECERPFPSHMTYESLVMSKRCPYCGCKLMEREGHYVNHGRPMSYGQPANGYNMAY